ncbi:MAG: hypothetical protein NVS4B11_37850 [Ktedonobacteraceae bacterium]
MWYRYRRGSRGMRYFWFLFIPLFFFAGHWGFGILIWIASIIILSLLGRAIFSAIAGANMWGAAQNQWYQPRNQQPYQPSQYQQQQPYQSYQQGYQQPYYQPRPEGNQASEQQYQAPQQQQYDQYEQPRAEYPQELPPMEQ